jgi:hypothetical protein
LDGGSKGCEEDDCGLQFDELGDADVALHEVCEPGQQVRVTCR